VLKRAYGGVLFIDEAYYLHRPENERDYGQGAIEILLQVMENDRDRLVVILAGYKDHMDEFFACSPGMAGETSAAKAHASTELRAAGCRERQPEHVASTTRLL
jgi:hypothetical protein